MNDPEKLEKLEQQIQNLSGAIQNILDTVLKWKNIKNQITSNNTDTVYLQLRKVSSLSENFILKNFQGDLINLKFFQSNFPVLT